MKIALIAGEASGDRLGGRLMEALLRKKSERIEFIGVGGPMMEAQGLTSFFPMQDIALMGFAEILPHIFRLKRLIHETVAFVEREEPDVLVTIDSPGFNYRVVKELRARGVHRPRLVHYVAPTVWAYKQERAKRTAALFDALLVLLPFEPPYFEKEGLKTVFVGHAVTEDEYDPEQGRVFRAEHGIAEDALMLCVLPGSRKGELAKLLPVFAAAAKRFGKTSAITIPATSYSAQLIARMPQDWPTPPIIVTGEANKRAAMLASDVALAKSGTVTLEAAMAGLPMLTAYKVNPVSAWLLKRMITTRFVSLINILLNREVIPEYLQERCDSVVLAQALTELWNDTKKQEAQREAYAIALGMLCAPSSGNTPSDIAADAILST